MRRNKIITIDGPSGIGKTTIAKEVARRLHLPFIASGRLFRATAWILTQKGISVEDQEMVNAHIDEVTFTMTPSGVIQYEGRSITPYIDDSEVGILASKIARYNTVRQYIIVLQHHLAKENGCVVEGRSTAIEVFPHASLKIWLTADLERRIAWVTEKYGKAAASTIRERDATDRSRTNAPMQKADDAIEIITTSMTIDEVIEKIVTLFKQVDDQ